MSQGDAEQAARFLLQRTLFDYHWGAMKKWTFLLLFGVIIIALSVDIAPSAAQASDAYSVVAAVNAFRTANGLPALQIDNALMAAAQAHSEYQASIGQVTHTGAGGSRPVNRAAAFGFGGGAQIFVSENIAGGLNMAIDTAIYSYWQDSLHLHTMLNPAALFIGAGMAKNGDYVYYTVDTGYYIGASGSGTQPTTAPGETYDPPPTSGPAIDPFVISTPLADGALVHVVGYGQTLIGIANTYEVEVAEVLNLNNLTLDSIIYPGDKIILKPSYTPTATEIPTTPVPTATPSATVIPTKSSSQPGVSYTIPDTSTPSITPSPTPLVISPEREPVVVGAVLFALAVFLSVIIGGLLKRSKRSQQDTGA